MIGIYKIENATNGKVYIGQSRNIQRRWYTHRSDLRCGRHENQYLQKAYNADPSAFRYSVVVECPSELLNDLEAYYIARHGSANPQNGYNIDLSPCGTGRISEVSRRAMSEAKRHKMRSVICITTGVIYDCLGDAARETGDTAQKIYDCCSGRRKSSHGRAWAYLCDYEADPQRYTIIRRRCNNTSGVICIETGKHYRTATEAARCNGTSDGSICSCCRGRVDTAGGLHWRYADDGRKDIDPVAA